MKKVIIIGITFLLCMQIGYTQNNNNLQFHSISISPVGIYLDNETGGIALNLDLSLKSKKHLFKLAALTGSEVDIQIFGPNISESFIEYNIMYGREFSAKKWLYFDLFSGLGYFNHIITIPKHISGTGSGWLNTGAEYKYNTINNRTVGFPLQTRIRFQTGKKFGLGLQFHANINNVNSTFSTGFFLQWKFRRR